MSKFCRDIHGIYYEDLRESPEFTEVWQSVKQLLISADCVVIHNAPFDLRHLRNILSLYNLPSVSFDYICSLQLCRYHFPEAHSHSLNCMADMFGISVRTVRRDVVSLSESFPIVTDLGRHGGVSLMKKGTSDKSLTGEQYAFLLSLLQSGENGDPVYLTETGLTLIRQMLCSLSSPSLSKQI